MRNLAFVIWMIGYPLANTLSIYLNHRIWDSQTDSQKGVTSLLMTATWFFVGWLLYE